MTIGAAITVFAVYTTNNRKKTIRAAKEAKAEELIFFESEAEDSTSAINAVKDLIPHKSAASLENTISNALEDAENVVDKAKSVAQKSYADAKSAAEKSFSDAKSAAEQSYSDAKSVADKSLTNAKSSIDKAVEDAGNVVDKVVADAGNALDKTVSSAKSVVDKTITDAGNALDDSVSSAKSAVDKAVADAGHAVEKVVEDAGNVLSDAGNAFDKKVAEAGKALSDAGSVVDKTVSDAGKALDKSLADAGAAVDELVDSLAISGTTPEDLLQEADRETQAETENKGAYDPETGEINWDCPCLGGMANGPCGEEFKTAFSCFVYSKEEPKGIECIEKFSAMQNCFREHPDVYAEELRETEPFPEEEKAGNVDKVES